MAQKTYLLNHLKQNQFKYNVIWKIKQHYKLGSLFAWIHKVYNVFVRQ